MAALESVRQMQDEQTHLLKAEIQITRTNQAILMENQASAEFHIGKTNKPLHEMRKEIGALVATQHGIYDASRFLRHSDITTTAPLRPFN